ncbi:hypothetical protein EON65_13925 [archaeon]|nr:MAG: hypothetical protein EON65_13925 [archaeon]
MPSKWMKDFLAKKYEDHRKRVRRALRLLSSFYNLFKHIEQVKEARTTLAQGKPPEMPMSMRREMERVSFCVILSPTTSNQHSFLTSCPCLY